MKIQCLEIIDCTYPAYPDSEQVAGTPTEVPDSKRADESEREDADDKQT